MNRIVRISPRFLAVSSKSSPRESAQIVRELGRLSTADSLPLAGDYEIVIPPTRTGWVRRIPQSNMWLVYAWDDAMVRALRLLRSPPVPLD